MHRPRGGHRRWMRVYFGDRHWRTPRTQHLYLALALALHSAIRNLRSPISAQTSCGGRVSANFKRIAESNYRTLYNKFIA